MIIFYDKTNGNIIGTIDGRVHIEAQLNMWIGDKNKTDRLIVNWKPITWYDKNGKKVRKEDPNVYTADFEPDHHQKDLFKEFDKNSSHVYDYKIDVKTKSLLKKGVS